MGDTIQTAGQLNLIVCGLAFIVCLTALWRLSESKKKIYEFVFRAMVCWTAGWAVWTALWAIIASQGEPHGLWKQTTLVLSNTHTILQVLFCLGIIRGSKFGGRQYAAFAALVLCFVLFVHFSILFFTMDVAEVLQERWSLTLGMFASTVVGLGFLIRYGTPWVLAAGIAYTAMQPLAYEALYGTLKSAAFPILALLAFLKAPLAWSAIHYIGVQPTDGEALLKIGNERPNAKKHDGWWPALPWTFILIAACAFLADFGYHLYRGSSLSTGQTLNVVEFLAALVTILGGLAALYKKLRPKTGGPAA